DFYKEMIALSGKDDTRFLVRGKVDWDFVETQLNQKDSFEAQIYHGLSKMLQTRKEFTAFGRGDIIWNKDANEAILSYQRNYKDEHILIIQNLSEKEVSLPLSTNQKQDLLGQNIIKLNEQAIIVKPYSFYWLSV
ncbi:MAG: alpha-glucosidase C-terminal domain-containing protein, partial [Bacteroidales bacterium]|nr:alpha-glucosidase C-terminal domain-containing protein [Bacteroidales bacterium]